mgnify:CR=1 FL=1
MPSTICSRGTQFVRPRCDEANGARVAQRERRHGKVHGRESYEAPRAGSELRGGGRRVNKGLSNSVDGHRAYMHAIGPEEGGRIGGDAFCFPVSGFLFTFLLPGPGQGWPDVKKQRGRASGAPHRGACSHPAAMARFGKSA